MVRGSPPETLALQHLARLAGPLARALRDGLSPKERLISRVSRANLTYLGRARLRSVFDSCVAAERTGLQGCFIEAGCALGGSSILIAHAKARSRPLFIFDVFGMIPAPGERDPDEVHARYDVIRSGSSRGLGSDRYYGYEDDLLGKVRANLGRFGVTERDHNVRLVRGLIQDTMSIGGPVAFAHVDVDWFDPVTCALSRIFPNLVEGGSIVVDDYFDWESCRRAVDAFLDTHGHEVTTDGSAGSLKITRTAARAPTDAVGGPP
jgi:hypothetical protein